MIDKLLKKARQSLRTARLDLDAGDADGSVNRSYYAAYYAAWAMFAAQSIEKPKTHSGMISEFSRRFVKDGPLDPALGATLRDGGLPRISGGSASTLPFSRPAQRSLLVTACMLAKSL